MRKLLMASLCLILSISLHAQEAPIEKTKKEKRTERVQPEQEPQDPPRGKKGQLILPEAGEFGLGFNIIPFFNWFGNSFNATERNEYANDNRLGQLFGTTVISARYMLKDNAALRLNFGINVNTLSSSNFVAFNGSTNTSNTVEDTRSLGGGTYAVGMGYEKRRGKGRIQGYYGGEILLRISHTDGASYSYGNDFSAQNIFPTSTNWGNNILAGGSERVLSSGATLNASFGVRAFVGIEYFVAPKISIGAEFGWGMSYNTIPPNTQLVEFFDTNTNQTSTREQRSGSGGQFYAGLDNLGGAILMNFYF